MQPPRHPTACPPQSSRQLTPSYTQYLQEVEDNPYKFVVSESAPTAAAAKYAVLSREGLVRYSRGHGGEADKSSFREFVYEQSLYHKLKAIAVFANFRRWKAFSIWRSAVSRAKFSIRSEQLSKKLLHLDRDLRPLMFRCAEVASSLRHLELLVVERHTIYEIEEFQALQQRLQKQVRRAIPYIPSPYVLTLMHCPRLTLVCGRP